MAKDDTKRRLISSFQALGLEIAGHRADHLRWSATDLATLLVKSNEHEGDMTRANIFRDMAKMTVQDVLKQRGVEVIRTTDASELLENRSRK